MAIGRNMSLSAGSHLLQFCLKPTTNYIRCHNWMTDLSTHAVIVYCTWNDCLTLSFAMIYCNATMEEKTGVKAKIASMCKHPDRAYLGTAKLTTSLTHFKAPQLPFQPPRFQGTLCIYHLKEIDFFKECKINLFDCKAVGLQCYPPPGSFGNN